MMKKLRFVSFSKNEHAVIGLPMRLTVSLVIGGIALIAILSFVLNPCLFPQKMIVSIKPMVNMITGDDLTNIKLTVYVNDSNGKPVKDALVKISGHNSYGYNLTDKDGKAIVNTTINMKNIINEAYLDAYVKANCYETFSQEDMIKIIKN